ncbi:hypothetical protein A2U01_0026103, partial [Trifolium medium]|nr:hypothetical protein [Trifolium medium]
DFEVTTDSVTSRHGKGSDAHDVLEIYLGLPLFDTLVPYACT